MNVGISRCVVGPNGALGWVNEIVWIADAPVTRIPDTPLPAEPDHAQPVATALIPIRRPEPAERRTRSWDLSYKTVASRDAFIVAIHEAGHAIVGFVDGAGIAEVFLASDASGLLRGSYRPRDASRMSARMMLGGRAAVEIIGTLPAGWDDAKDLAGWRRLSHQELIWPELAEAKELLRAVWPAVYALADELWERAHVSGDEAEAIVLDHLTCYQRNLLAERS